MVSKSLADLRYLYYGGGPGKTVTDAEYAFLKTATGQQVTALDVLQLVAPSPATLQFSSPGSPVFERPVFLVDGQKEYLSIPDRSVGPGDELVTTNPVLTLSEFENDEDLTVTVILVVVNAARNRVRVIRKEIDLPAGSYLIDQEFNFSGATVDVSTGSGLTFHSATGVLEATSNGTYSIALALSVSVS